MAQPNRGPRVAVIALDGFDPALISRESVAGMLPALAKAFGDAREVRLSGGAPLQALLAREPDEAGA